MPRAEPAADDAQLADMTATAERSRDGFAAMTASAMGEDEVEETMTPEQGFAFWCRYFRYRVRTNYDAVEVITGDEGKGKSTYALRKAEALTRGRWNPENLCYSAEDVLRAYQRARKGEVIIYDEAVRGLLAGETFEEEQRSLIKALALVREKGVILLLCAPSIWLVAKQVRGRRATLWTHIQERGSGLVHERDVRLSYKPTQALRFTVSPLAPHVTWRPFQAKDPFYRGYLAVKHARLQDFLAETLAELEDAKGRGARGRPRAADAPEPGPPSAKAVEKKRRQGRLRQRRHREKLRRAELLRGALAEPH